MSRLEVDVKSIQKVIRDRAVKAQKTLVNFEAQAEKAVRELVADVRQTFNSSPVVKNLRKSPLYHRALKAKDELKVRARDTQERVLDLLNVPTKRDLDRLDQKVEKLTKKLKADQRGRKTAETKTE